MHPEQRYSGISAINHWVTAILVFVMLTLGLLAYFATNDAVENFVIDAHIALGFVTFLFVIWRVAYRLYEGFPPNADKTMAERRIAWLIHRTLLIVLVLLVVTGPLYLFTEGEGVNVFGWFTISIPLESLAFLHEPSEWVHVNIGLYLLPAILVVHFLGALRYYWKRGQDTLSDL